jgi:hypothetical protein
MIKATVIGRIKPETVVCIKGKIVYLVEDDCCFLDTENYIRANAQVNSIIFFDEWFWQGNSKELCEILRKNMKK